jgi:glycosyltransferase involved in cell wall biosynthesis
MKKKEVREKVSIIVINYNDKMRVRRAIESAVNQTYENVEVIVVDDGSDAETRELYTDFNDMITLIQLEREDVNARTPSRARNAGLEQCTGEYVAVLDSDNYFAHDFVEEMMKHPSDVSFCDWSIIGLNPATIKINRVWKPEDTIIGNYLRFTHLDHQCLLIKKEVLDKVGHYDERLPRSQDCDLIIRLMIGTQNWNYVERNLFFFDNHEVDQMKHVASIYGKTLWSLKNNINITWLGGFVQSNPLLAMSFYLGINHFMNKPEWKETYDNSDFKKVWIDDFSKTIGLELTEEA